ncbi:MAG: hypothetical protein ACQET3_05890, partial [Promethearchaeati archaeon]
IPESWTQSGYFILRANYPGSRLITSSSAQETSSLHIFNDLSFSSTTPSRVAPGQSFTIGGRCLDTESRPIMNRDFTLNLNGTSTVTITTDEEGRITYRIIASDSEGDFIYEITLISDTGNILLGSYTVEIRRATVLSGDTLWSLGWIAIISIEVIAGLVLVRKYRYSGYSRRQTVKIHNNGLRQ